MKYLIFSIICLLISIGSFITSCVFQVILSIEKYGVIFGHGNIVIPHWSLIFIAIGIIFAIIARIMGD